MERGRTEKQLDRSIKASKDQDWHATRVESGILTRIGKNEQCDIEKERIGVRGSMRRVNKKMLRARKRHPENRTRSRQRKKRRRKDGKASEGSQSQRGKEMKHRTFVIRPDLVRKGIESGECSSNYQTTAQPAAGKRRGLIDNHKYISWAGMARSRERGTFAGTKDRSG
jgi:hypothetical protein